jgi:hypothetical protein
MNGRNVPRDLKYIAIQSSLDYMKARHAHGETFLNHLKQIQEKYTREINEFLGPKSKEYSAFYEKRREAVRSMQPRFTVITEGPKIENEFRKTRLAEANEFIKTLDINANDLKSIRDKYQEEFRQFIEKEPELTNSKQEGL